jgi:hypothetical protein
VAEIQHSAATSSSNHGTSSSSGQQLLGQITVPVRGRVADLDSHQLRKLQLLQQQMPLQ